jgi:glycosyltransferase involved in cell wall biosynthesis
VLRNGVVNVSGYPFPRLALANPFFSICIITFRRTALLQQCLACIAPGQQTLDSSLYEIIVSDDCPEGSSRDVVAQTGFAHWVQGPSSGVAANRNNVAKCARGHWIVFVDDDEWPEPDWLENFYLVAKSSHCDVLEGRVEPIDYPDSLLWYAPSVSSGGIFCTANLAIRQKVLFALGGFDESLRVSHEDMELGYRIHKAGLRSQFIENALVKHPARRISFSQAWRTMIQQQCQAFALQHRDGYFGGRESPDPVYISFWSLRFFIRCLRLEWACKLPAHWRRPIQSILLRIFVLPIASIKILFSSDHQVLANQKS